MKKIRISQVNWPRCFYYVLLIACFKWHRSYMIATNYLYYLLIALLSIICGIVLLLHLKKNNNRLTVEKVAYILSYSFFICYICFGLAMYGLSNYKSIKKIEAKFVAYDINRTNSIVYDIGNKRYTTSFNVCQYVGHNEKDFIRNHKVVLEVKEPINGLYLISNITLDSISLVSH